MSKAYLLIWCILGLAACGTSSTDQAQNNKAPDGHQVFKLHCVLCHGAGAVSGGYAPDLRASTIPLYEDALADVMGGSRQMAGMPRFTELTASDRKALQHYIRREARAAAP